MKLKKAADRRALASTGLLLFSAFVVIAGCSPGTTRNINRVGRTTRLLQTNPAPAPVPSTSASAFRLLDTKTNSPDLTTQQDVKVSFAAPAAATHYCISESQVARPASTLSNCIGGPGPQSGWTTGLPSTFRLSLGDGSKTVHLWYATSKIVLNVEPVSARILQDRVPPQINVISGPASVSNSRSAEIRFEAVDGSGSGVQNIECKRNTESQFKACASPVIFSSLNEGVHSLEIRARDRAGHVSETKKVEWQVNLAAPSLAFNATPPALTNQAGAQFQFTSSTPQLECKLNGGAFQPCTSPRSITAAEGANQFSVRATNVANDSSTTIDYSWTLDSVAPSIVAPLPPASNAASATLLFAVSDTGSGPSAGTAQCFHNGSPIACSFAGGYLAVSLSSIADGTHQVFVKIADLAGNSRTSPTVSWTKTTPGSTGPNNVTALDFAEKTFSNPNPLTDTRRFGWSLEEPTAPPFFVGPAALQKACHAGISWVRYWLNWGDFVQAQSGTVFNWEMADRDIEALMKLGMNVYINVMYAPSWAAQDTLGLSLYKCAGGRDPATNFLIGRPECNFTVKIDDTSYRNFVRTAVERYGSKVKHWAFTNEPENFYMPISGWPESHFNYLVAVGGEVAKSVYPDIRVVGPDACCVGDPQWNDAAFQSIHGAGWGARYRASLQGALQADLAYRTTHGRNLFDVISFHGYADVAGGTALNGINNLNVALNRFKTLLDQYDPAGTREVWVTEGGLMNSSSTDPGQLMVSDDTGVYTRMIYEAITARPWIKKYMPHGFVGSKGGISLILEGPGADRTRATSFSTGSVYSATQTFTTSAQGPAPVSCQTPIDSWPEYKSENTLVTQIDNNVPHGSLHFATACSRYFATRGAGFSDDTTFAITNPNAVTAKVRMYAVSDKIRAKVIEIKPNSVRFVKLADAFKASCYSMTFQSLTSGAPIFVEKYTGASSVSSTTSAHGHATSLPSPASTQVYFADGNANFDYFHTTDYTIYNPNGSTANIDLRFYGEGGNLIRQRNIAVPGHAREWIGFNRASFPDVSGVLHTVISSSQPIVASRTEYFGKNGAQDRYDHITEESGIPALSTRIFKAEGHTGFSSYLLIQNPHAQATSGQVTARNANGIGVRTVPFNIPALGKIQFGVNEEILNGTGHSGDYSIEIQASQGVAAEQFTFTPNSTEGHIGAAVTPASRWIVPYVSDVIGSDSYLIIRAVDGASTVRLTGYLEGNSRLPGGEVSLGDVNIAANGRASLGTQIFPAVANKRFSVKVEVVSGAQVVVEKVLYQGDSASQYKGSSLSSGIAY